MGGETLYDVRDEASATGIPPTEICNNLLLFQWPTHFQWRTHLSSLF